MCRPRGTGLPCRPVGRKAPPATRWSVVRFWLVEPGSRDGPMSRDRRIRHPLIVPGGRGASAGHGTGFRAAARPARKRTSSMIEHYAHGPTRCLRDDQPDYVLVGLPAERRHESHRFQGVSGRDDVPRSVVGKNCGDCVFRLEFRGRSRFCVAHWRAPPAKSPLSERMIQRNGKPASEIVALPRVILRAGTRKAKPPRLVFCPDPASKVDERRRRREKTVTRPLPG